MSIYNLVERNIDPAAGSGRMILENHLVLFPDGKDEAIARAFFAEIGRRDGDPVNDAVIDYETRVAEDRPYEDATSVDDLRRSLGR